MDCWCLTQYGIAQSLAVVKFEYLVELGSPQVTVNEQDRFACIRHYERQVRRDKCLPLLWNKTRNENGPRRVVGKGENYGRPEASKRLCDRRFGFLIYDYLCVCRFLAGLFRKVGGGDKGNTGCLDVLLHILWGLDRIIQVLAEERKAAPHEETDHNGERYVPNLVRPCRGPRCLGWVDDPHVRGPQFADNVRLLLSF